MQVSVENTGGLERKLTVQIPGDEINDKVLTKLRELSKQVRIKGFRPGRVPMSVVRPPSRAPKAKGRSNFEAGIPVRRPISTTTGREIGK